MVEKEKQKIKKIIEKQKIIKKVKKIKKNKNK